MVAPEQFVNQLIKAMDNEVFIRGMATVIPVPTAASLGVPSLDSDPDDPAWTAELKTGTDDTGMSFGKRDLHPHTPWPSASRSVKSSFGCFPRSILSFGNGWDINSRSRPRMRT